MLKLLSTEIIPNNIKENMRSTERLGVDALVSFVEDRLTDKENLWTKMTKVKLLSWTSSAKEIKLKSGSEVLTLKETSSVFASMLVIARSSGEDINLEEVIGNHEFA